MSPLATRLLAILATFALLAAACGNDDADEAADGEAGPAETTTTTTTTTAPVEPDDDDADDGLDQSFERVPGVTLLSEYDGATVGLERWQQEVPGLEDVRIESSLDGTEQPSLWLPPAGDGPSPLLVVLHSWSYGYLQHFNIPFGQWAQQRGWAMVAPNFRGAMETPEATGSDLAVQDVVDAIDYAVANADIDEDHVFTIGVSGGGYMSLLMAGRHPDRFAGSVAWVPIHDLVDWYAYNAAEQPQADYADQIAASCGGPPTTDDGARQQCAHRSPMAHLEGARDAGLPVYIAHGLFDEVVPAHHAVRAFNQLADPEDALAEGDVEAIRGGDLPEHLTGTLEAESWFTDEDPEVFFTTRSGDATLVIFDGGHDMAYHPGLEWMVREVGSR